MALKDREIKEEEWPDHAWCGARGTRQGSWELCIGKVCILGTRLIQSSSSSAQLFGSAVLSSYFNVYGIAL